MFVLKGLLLTAAILACNAQAPPTTPVPILKQINKQNDDGSYSYGYEAADGSFKIETKYPNGDVAGKYGYVDENGKTREISYGASSQRGFEPQGDSGYPQRPWLMTPYLDPPQHSIQETFNSVHTKARALIENTFGRLKNRWRCLHRDRTLHYQPEKCARIILACCVLHNIAVKYNIPDPEDASDVEQLQGSGIMVPPPTLHDPTSSNALTDGQEDDGQYREDPKIYEDPKYNSRSQGRQPATTFKQFHQPAQPTAAPAPEPQYQRYTQPAQRFQSFEPAQYQQPNQASQFRSGPLFSQQTSLFSQTPQQFPQENRPQSQVYHTQPQFSYQAYQPQPYQQNYQPQYQQAQNYQPQYQAQQNIQPQNYQSQNFNPFVGHPAQNFDPNTGSYSINFTG